jgi:hypothetical protein
MTAAVYMGAMGPQGMAQAASQSMAKAHYLAAELCKIPGVSMKYEGPYFHEFVVEMPKVEEVMAALEKAVANAKDSAATAADSLNVALVSANSYSSKDASAEADGVAQIDTTIVAAVVNAEGKVVVADTDCTQGKMTFNATGATTLDTTTVVKTKLEQGYDYNMAAFGKKHDGSEGKPLEWFEQAAEFNKALVGKTASEFAALAGADTYATGDLAVAGCTMAVGDMIAAAVKASTVA